MNDLSLNENYLYTYLSERKDKDNKVVTTALALQNELSLGRRVLAKNLHLLSSKNIISYSSSNKGLTITILNNDLSLCTRIKEHVHVQSKELHVQNNKCTNNKIALESDLKNIDCTNEQVLLDIFSSSPTPLFSIYKLLLLINKKLNKLNIKIKDKEREIYKEKEIEKKAQIDQKKFPQNITLENVILAFDDFVQAHVDRYPALSSLDTQLESEHFLAYWSERNWKDKNGKAVKSIKGRVATWLANWLKSFNPKSVTALQQAQTHAETREQKIARMQREIENGQIFDYQTSKGNVIDGNSSTPKIDGEGSNFGDMPF
jgi:hypothetical protein